MIFKQVVVSVLNKVLGKYIKDLDTSNLELAILSGQAVLKSLELKEDALREFDLPVEVTYGYVGQIFLSIPWTNLYSSPCYISIENVYLIAGPVKDKPYDAEKTRATEVSIKRKRLKQIEESAKAKGITPAEATTTDGSDSSFVEKLIAQVVKNLKVTVQNIHFRYEDKVTSADSPFAFGFTLNNLSAETTDQEWKTCIVDAAETTIYKLVSLDNLAVYWNTKLDQSSLFSGQSNWKMKMKDGISRKGNIQGKYEFILHPLSAECHVILDQSSVVEIDTPKLLVEVIQQELALTLSQKQFHNIMDLLDSFELMTINQKYKKYQPTQLVHGNCKKWWKYAYTAICEEKIRCWSWDRMKAHRTKYKAYKELYKTKLKGFHDSEMERSLNHLQILEDDLDIPSILIGRQQAEIEVPPNERKPKEVNQPSAQTGWWSWMGMGASASTAAVSATENEEYLFALTVAALPAEEKEKLYQAINYSENTAPIKYPVEYVKRRLTFNLDSCKVVLLDNNKSKIAEISTKGFAAALEQRPGGDAVMFSCEVNSFQVHGTQAGSDSDRPRLVSSKTSFSGMGNALLWFSFELNPLDVQADYSVKLKIEPVEVNYDNMTIDNIIDFFDVPNKSKLYELEAAAANKLHELQSWTRAGLEYAISQHKITYVDMDIRSPYIVIPEYGNLKREGSVLIVDLGHLRVISDLVSRTKTIAQASDDEIAKMFYDQFNVMITDVQVILADKDSDWRVLHKQDATPDHILPSIGLELQAFKSISAEYPEMPEFKVKGVIPKIWLKLSDKKYKELMQFIKNFPFGKESESQTTPRTGSKSLVDKEWTHNLSTLSLEEAQGIQNICREAFHTTEDDEGEVWFDSVEYLPKPRKESKVSTSPERTQLLGEFAIQQLLVTIDKADAMLEKPYISLEIKNLSTTLTVNTWNISATTTLGFIELLDNHFHGPGGSSLCVLSSKSKKKWIAINYVKADPKGPEFSEKFNNTEQRIKIVFSSIELTAQQEALASFEMFVLALLQSDESDPILPAVRKQPIPLETIAEDEVLNARPISPVSRSVIDMCIEAEMEEVSVTLIAKEKTVGQIKVTGLDVKVNVRGPETKINTMLKDLSILNAAEGTIYPKILCLQDNTVFDCEITLFDTKRKSNDPLALDVIVDLKLGRFTFVFLSGFTAHIQNFLQALVSPETVSYAQNITQKAIKTKAQGIQESGSKIGLNISVHAPQLIIPGHSFSKDMMIADLGRLEITNAISKAHDGVLMDNMAVTLKSFEVRCLSENVKNATDYLIEPIKLDVTVRRRLQITKSNLPLIEVDAVLPLLKINIAIPDYKLLMMVLNRNLSEGKEELDTPPRIASEESLDVAEDRVEEFRQRIASVFEPFATTEASTSDADEQVNLKCNFNVQKVIILSPLIVEDQIKPYLVLDIEKLLTTVTLDTWTINVQADLGTIDLIDRMNTDPDEQPVSIISSPKEEDLISVGYTMVDPACPEFESTHCSVNQTANVEFRKLKINCPQKSAIDLQAHVLALTSSIPQATEEPTDASSSSSTSSSQSTSFKLGATLWEVDVVIGADGREFANVNVKGLAADILMSDGGVFLKSTQRDLSITDLNPNTYYPKIISVENENVFDFEFKYYGTTDSVYSSGSNSSGSSSELKPDGSLDMNIGRVNVVFVYRFVDELMRYFEPLTSPQSTKYVQEAASKTVYTQFESLQSQGTRIALDVKINAPLIVMPRHSSSIDMLIADLGHLELQNEFEVFEVADSREKIVFDMMELTLQSVQLARGRMDLSNSSVVKRYLIEPIKMDANIRRSLKPSCHDFPFIEANASLDFVKMNLGMKDYQLLTTITQENLYEGNGLHAAAAVDANLAQEQVIVNEQNVPDVGSSENDSADTSSLATSSEETWEYMAFAFDVPGVTLTLYSNEKDLDPFDSQSPIYDPETALCCCDVDKTSLQIDIPSDCSVLVQGILHGISVEDIRQNSCSEFPRLIDKKLSSYSKDLTSSQDMCEFIYSQKVNGDMDVVLQLQNAAIFVSFPFMWPLIEFFTAMPSIQTEEEYFMTPAESQTSLDAPPSQSSQNGPPQPSSRSPNAKSSDPVPTTNERSSPNALNGVPVSKPSQVTADYKMTVRGTVKKPDIVLLANPLIKDSEALILQTEVEFEYTMENENQNLRSVISGLQMLSCQFPNIKDTSLMVLSPCDVILGYKTPLAEGKGQGITIECEDMKFQCSPALYHIINDVVLNLSGQEKVTEGVQTDGEQRINPPDDLWEPHPTTADRWRRKTAQSTVNNTVCRQSTGDKITLNTKEVQVLLVNEVHNTVVPLLLMKTQVEANALDYTAQMKLEADISVEVTYYTERLGAWEPLIELVDEDRDNPRWELQLKIFFADGYISSFTPRDQESIDGPPQDMTDGPDAHRWIAWQHRPRSESKKALTAKPSILGKHNRKSFKSSKRDHRRKALKTKDSDEEEDLDYEGALQHFVLSSTRLVGPELVDTKLDQVDSDVTDDGFLPDEVKPQATYIVLNSHDVIQLTVTPTSLGVLTDLSTAFTEKPERRVRSIQGPTFSIRNELGIHASVIVAHDEKILDKDDEILTVCHRKPKLERNTSLTDAFANMAVKLLAEHKRSRKKRLFSEPILDRFRQTFSKIQKNRSASLPLALEGKPSKSKTAKFHIGEWKKRRLEKSGSCDSGSKTRSDTSDSDIDDDDKSMWKTRMRRRKNELFSLAKHLEEDETDSAVDAANTSTLSDIINEEHTDEEVGQKVSFAVGNVGALIGGISSPSFSDNEAETSSPKQETEESTEDSVDGRREQEEERYLAFQVNGFYIVEYVPISRSGRYLYKLKPRVGNETNLNSHAVVQVDIKNGLKTVILRSPLQLFNHLAMPVDLLMYDDMKIGKKKPFKYVQTVDPGTTSNIPLSIAHDKDLYIKPHFHRCDVCPDSISWRLFSKNECDFVLKFPQEPLVTSLESLESLESLGSEEPLQVKVRWQEDILNKKPSNDVPHHVIHLHPPITLHNLLPVEIARLSKDNEEREELVLPGEKVPIMTESVEHSCQLIIKLKNYKEEDWVGTLNITKETGKTTELVVTSLRDSKNQLVLGVLIIPSGTTDITLYSPYWLINKTSFPTEYRVSKTHQIYYQSAVDDQPVLFNFTGKSSRRVRLKIQDCPWSKRFSLDAVGDCGVVSCYNSKKTQKFEFVVQIEMSQTGLTKIITLTPKYVVINKTEFSISYCEDGSKSPLWFAIEPDEIKPFWPRNSLKQILIKPTLSLFASKAIPFEYSHTTVLRMFEPRAINVEVHGEVEDSVTTILFTPFSPGVATIRIENLCDDVALRFMQEDAGHVTILQPQFSILYTWDDPTKTRRLLWKPYLGVDDAMEAPVSKDDNGQVQLEINENGPDLKEDRKAMEDTSNKCVPSCIKPSVPSSDSDDDAAAGGGADEVDGVAARFRRNKRSKKTIYWVSILDGLQRVLIFTQNGKLAAAARRSSECEPVTFELFVSLDGVGMSLMNSKPEEVANITLSSSTSVWQVEKSAGRWKTLGIELASWLEDAWKNGKDQIKMDEKAEVDFSRMFMKSPHEGALRRSFEPAFWFHYCSSQHYQSVHCKMHRIQIDNQLYGTVFPVVLYPAPLPPGVATRHGPKPFIEMSVIYHEVPGQGVYHFKYAKALVQEMNVKLDKSFIIAIGSLLSKPPEEYNEEEYFKTDMNRVKVHLRETMAVKAALQTQRVFLEYFHLSPLKINLSFSLVTDGDEEFDQQFAENIMDFFIDSIGATLTDMNDAQLKLAFFERVGVFITQENLQAQITTHYTMQGVRQVYALVLGLDVLGNPYALISGIGEGVKDLFYEPYQGIIYGPQEFAEGLARGVKSLLGHVVGGTAGAFSRITGSIGQAVAALTFDTEYRLKRRQRMYVEPSGIGQGLMMGGKSLVMGLVFGIGGVVTKPIEGAKSEGVEGFFKGIGKGFLGLLMRPTGGVIDMVSFTLDGIKRSAEQGGEDIAYRMRLPRFAAPDEPLKPYSEEEAKGFGILRSLPRSLELSRDMYVSDYTITDEDNSGLVLMTNKRIIKLYQSRFWHEWKVNWMCSYDEVSSAPFIASNSLVIKYQASGTSEDITTNFYEICSNNPEDLKALKSKISGLLRRYK